MLRNPSDKPQSFGVDVAKAFELPVHAARAWSAKSPWKSDAATASVELRAGAMHEFQLKPFEVLVLEMTPAK